MSVESPPMRALLVDLDVGCKETNVGVCTEPELQVPVALLNYDGLCASLSEMSGLVGSHD